MRAIASTARASRVTVGQVSRLNANSAVQTSARRIMEASAHVIHGMLQDGLPSQVASYLSGDRDRFCRLLAVTFFQQFYHCGQEAKEATFSHLDAMISALAAPRNAEDTELLDCLCSLIHEIVF